MTTKANGIVTLMTDFGTVDGYVAAMKGALLSVCPRATLVDVTHHIPSQDVIEAAFQLSTVWSTFPDGTVHVVVVDPGVGSDRRALAVAAGGQYFLAPDNGLLTLLTANVPPDEVIALNEPRFFRSDVSSTFHGRDIFAPVAGHLASGRVKLAELGAPLDAEDIVRLPWAPVDEGGPTVCGPVVSIDRFGNCRTLITRRHLRGDLAHLHVRCGNVAVREDNTANATFPELLMARPMDFAPRQFFEAETAVAEVPGVRLR